MAHSSRLLAVLFTAALTSVFAACGSGGGGSGSSGGTTITFTSFAADKSAVSPGDTLALTWVTTGTSSYSLTIFRETSSTITKDATTGEPVNKWSWNMAQNTDGSISTSGSTVCTYGSKALNAATNVTEGHFACKRPDGTLILDSDTGNAKDFILPVGNIYIGGYAGVSANNGAYSDLLPLAVN